MQFKTILAVSALGMAMSSTAAAGPFFIDIGQDLSGDGNTFTHDINKLEANTTLFTSFYLVEADGSTGRVFDTNIQDRMNDFGFADAVGETNPATGVAVNTFRYPTMVDPSDDYNFTGFAPSGSPSSVRNEFDASDWIQDTGEDDPSKWGLSFDYFLEGTFDPTATDIAGSVNYTDGFINIFYEADNTSDRIQVATLNVTSSSIVAGNIEISGFVGYDFLGGVSNPFVENFFTDVNTGRTYFDLSQEEKVTVTWLLDTNVRPFDDLDELFLLTGVSGGDFEGDEVRMRQNTGNTGIQFATEVPEPGIVILLGTGFIALGLMVSKRRRISVPESA